VDDLRTARLEEPSHDVDCGIVSVEEGGCGHDANVVLWLVRHGDQDTSRGEARGREL